MEGFWMSKRRRLTSLVVCCLHLLTLRSCWSLNDEGVALLRFKEKVESDPYGALSNWRDEIGLQTPCFWSGVECSQGYVVALNLRDLCLRGTLSPAIGDLVHAKSIILRNNSFSGVIPQEMANLTELKVLDLGHNNFSGQLPSNLSRSVLLLDNNKLFEVTSQRKSLQEAPSEERPVSRFFPGFQVPSPPDSNVIDSPPPPPATSSSPSISEPNPDLNPSPEPFPPPEPFPSSPSPSPAALIPPFSVPSPSQGPVAEAKNSRRNNRRTLILSSAIAGGAILLGIIGILIWKSGKVATVKPWATGISGQLQRAFVTGVPKLKRSELEAACEDFSNVIGSTSSCTLYKGTLSSGVEIAVASISVPSAKNWSNSLEAQFRKKIETLSKVNHKNFVNLIGYCVEDEPFTRMMVFEYAPNGTLFEHLHIREAEHLDWSMRMRIAMGIAYCLEHMHQLNPPLPHRNLNSSSVYLTEDYAAKVADFSLDGPSADVQSNVYSFGVVLFEMITGRLPYSAGGDPLDDWASDYVGGLRNLREAVDPTLETYKEDQLQELGGVIKLCVNREARLRPSMREVCERLTAITGVGPDGAVPRLSPLWWAELEILSTEAS